MFLTAENTEKAQSTQRAYAFIMKTLAVGLGLRLH